MSAAVSDRKAGGEEGAEAPATLGQWLDARIPKAETERAEGLVGASETRRVVDALERLARRVDAQERRGAMGSAAMERALDDVADRVGAIEDAQSETSGRLFEALQGLERVHGGLADRLASLEVEGVRHKAFARLEDRASALETHLTQARNLTARELEGLREGMSRLGQAAQESIEDLTLRIENARYASSESVEALQAEASLLRKTVMGYQAETHARLHSLAADSSSVAELAGLRTQFLVSAERQDAALSRLTARMEALSAGTIQRGELEESARVVSAALAAMSARLDAQDQAFSRKDEVQQAIASVTAKLGEMDTQIGAGQREFAEHAEVSARAVEALGAQLSEVAQGAAKESRDQAQQRAEVERTIEDLRTRIEASAAQAEAVSEAARAAANARCDAIARVTEERIDHAAERSTAALDALEAAQNALDARVRELGEVRLAEETTRLQAEFAVRSHALGEEMQAAILAARQEFEQRLDLAVSAIETGALATGLNRALARMEEIGKTQADLGESVSIELKRWSEAQDRRMRGIEARVEDSMSATGRLEARFASLEADSLGAASHTHEALSALSARIEERASASERRAGQALEQVGTQIIELAERMDQRQRALLQDLEDRLADFERRAGTAAQAHREELESRLQEVRLAVPAPQAYVLQADVPALTGARRPIPQSIPAAQDLEAEAPAHLPENAQIPSSLALNPGQSGSDCLDNAIEEAALPPAAAFGIQDPNVELEDHFIDDYAETVLPRYDLVDVLDAAISQDSARRKQDASSDPVRALLQERIEAAQPSHAPSSTAPAPALTPTLALDPGPAQDARDEPEPLDPVDMLLTDISSAPLILGPQDADAITLTSAMRVERAPASRNTAADDLFDSPLAKAAAESRAPREPSYLAAARRAAMVSAQEANSKRAKPSGPNLTRALFWAATAIAVGGGVYAISRETSKPAKPEKLTQLGADEPSVWDEAATREAAERTLQGAAQQIALGQDFAAQPVDLPEAGASTQEASFAPGPAGEPLGEAKFTP